MDDETIDRLRARTLAAVRKADIRRRRVHRGVLSVIAIAVAASLTAGGFALAASEPPPPLDPDIAFEQYQGGIAEQWAELHEKYPEAVRPNVSFVRFITKEEEDVVVAACLRAQGIPAVIDENGVGTLTPIGQEQEYDLAWFACTVQFPLDPSEYQPPTDEEMYFLYRYYLDEQIPCLEARGYDISAPPGFDDFLARWWAGEMWAPYTEVEVSDFATLEDIQDACPPLPPELRP